MPTSLGRMTKRPEFLRAAAAKRKWGTPGVVLQAVLRPPEEAGGPRVGYTASKRVGNAVERNRAKRRLRAAAALVLTQTALADTDYVLIARDATPDRPWPELLKDLETAARRLSQPRRSAS